jgi:peptide-methionine (R)-S-oxide reductase
VSQEKEEIKAAAAEKEMVYSVNKSEEEWRKELTDMEFYILRKAGTENPGSSELLKNKEKGTYVCAGCGTPLFKSEHKFDSGTGWPSFDREIEGNVSYDVDYKIGYKRTEEHCAVCGGHLGHVFEDGPRETTGLRHCINGAALNFVPGQ